MASRNNDLVRKLSKLYNAYTAIDDDRALRRSGMTLAEYNALPDVFTRLQNDGRAETFMSGLANYFQKFGFNVSEGNGVNFVITASSSIGRRRITASTSDMKSEFMRFTKELEEDIQDNNPAIGDNIMLVCDYVGDRQATAIAYITPLYNGIRADDIDTLVIKYNGLPYPNYVAYCMGNGDIIAQGESLRDISFDCYYWLHETVVAIWEENE